MSKRVRYVPLGGGGALYYICYIDYVELKRLCLTNQNLNFIRKYIRSKKEEKNSYFLRKIMRKQSLKAISSLKVKSHKDYRWGRCKFRVLFSAP